VDHRAPPAAHVLDADRLLQRLPQLNAVPTSNVLVHRQALKEAGPFDTRLRLTEDWDLYLRLARVGPPAFVPQHLVAFRTHPEQSSLNASGLLAELDRFERPHGVRTDRVPIIRGAAWSSLQAGHRRAALGLYGQAIVHGDPSSAARAAVALLPAPARARILSRTAAGRGKDLSDDQRWVDAVVGASS